MNVVFGSAFRNSTWYLRRYFDQLEAFRALNDTPIRLIAAEGDSEDRTALALQVEAESRRIDIDIRDVSHGGPWFGSVVSDERMTAMSKICNSIFDAVKPDDDVLVYVESDLVWDPHVIHTLVQAAYYFTKDFDVHSPMIYAGDVFYDVWAYRKNGMHFTPTRPFHPEFREDLMEVDSVGSCLVMHGEVARKARVRDDNCLVGWCKDARSYGYRIGVHTDLKVNHP